eukprot:g11006.t1
MPSDTLVEQTELDALRLENDTLRRNLGRLEEKVKRAEETILHQQEQPQPVQDADRTQLGRTQYNVDGQGSDVMQCGSAPLEVCHLHGILQWLHEAKADIVDNDRSKLQLESDVRLLYNLLDRAKKERRSYDVTIRQLERSLACANARAVELEEELQLQRRSFTRVLRSDRDVYEARTEAAQSIADRRGQHLKRIMSWVEKADLKFAEALGKLSAQAEEVGAANLGDLDGFAKEMSAEVDILRQGVAESMRSKSKLHPKAKSPNRGNAVRKEKKNKKTRKAKTEGESSGSPALSRPHADTGGRDAAGERSPSFGGVTIVEEGSAQSDTLEQEKEAV